MENRRSQQLARRTGTALLAAALLPFVGLATAQAAASPYDARAELIQGNIHACPMGTVELDAGDYDSSQTATDLSITAVDAGVTATHIYVKGGDDTHLYRPGALSLAASPPWSDLRSPDNRGDNLPDVSHLLVCGTRAAPTDTTTTEPSTATTTAPSTSTTTSTTTTEPSTTTTTTEPPTTTTTAPSATTTTPAVEVSGTRTTAPATTTTTAPIVGTTTTTPAQVLGVRTTRSGTEVLGSRTPARRLAQTGSPVLLAAGTSTALLLAGIGLMVASASFRRPQRKH